MEAAQHPRVVPPTARRALSNQTAKFAVISPSAPVNLAVAQLGAHELDLVAVLDDQSLVGLFSPHEYLQFMANQGDPAQALHTAMRACAVVAAPDDDIDACLQQMARHALRFLPVLDDGRLLGILSRADLLAASVAHHQRVYNAIDLDYRILFKRGTYSC